MLKFESVKAGSLDPETVVITRVDGKSMKDVPYLVINMSKPHAKEVYDVLKRYGYDIPEIEVYLLNLSSDND